ncbi:hypothetical protein [Parasulfitobacter algicola]|uniref:Uncharacterized protein n=1 Tax=Parasulfitobacter algicola TaxID=2614809 RepID=A0ABX2IUL6_9RHOB|nr:hypothetical protein [Sulfitobacter algicola]NSX53893.1 hypothetical protein [Sulfitobacter algicola]
MKKLTTALAAIALTASAAFAQETEMNFEVSGGYAFGQTHDIMDMKQSVIARAGHLTGAWKFRFENEDGPSGNAHLDAATLFRLTPDGPNLSGIMRFHMHEIDGSAPGTGWLYLSYDATELEFEGTSTRFVVEGTFVGGTGRFEGATGTLRVTSINGFDTGGGQLILAENN